ncbi:MAG: hypothetical protein KUG78_10795 [Kangiellaceae bacterium]|nr:hypothetical protein [Kangiellaceae bacterium]
MNKFWISCALLMASTIGFSKNNEKVSKEIQQAQQAAPIQVTKDASIRVWENGSFKEVVKGTNGFTCLVLKTPQGRFEPSCLNSQAMAFVFHTYEYHTKMRYQGVPEEIILKNLKKMSVTAELPAPVEGAIVYMQSENNVYERNGKLSSVPPHLMFFTGKLANNGYGFDGLPDYPGVFQGYPHLSALIVKKTKN